VGATQNAKVLLQDARTAMAAENFLEAKAQFKAIRKLLPRDVYVVQNSRWQPTGRIGRCEP